MSGVVYCDVKILHRMLMSELSSALRPPFSVHQQSIIEVGGCGSLYKAGVVC